MSITRRTKRRARAGRVEGAQRRTKGSVPVMRQSTPAPSPRWWACLRPMMITVQPDLIAI